MTPEALAKLFHETYESKSVEFGYKTREETAKPWDEIPADHPNKKLMIAVCEHVGTKLWNEALAAVEIESVCNGLQTVFTMSAVPMDQTQTEKLRVVITRIVSETTRALKRSEGERR